MKQIKILLFAILLFLINSCSESTTETIPKELLNTLWVLESFEVNGRIDIPPSNQVYNIQFKDDGKFTGTNDCNSISGNFTLNLNDINIGNIISTEVFCGKESLDYRYLEALDKADSYEVDRSGLTIYYEINSKLNFIVQ